MHGNRIILFGLKSDGRAVQCALLLDHLPDTNPKTVLYLREAPVGASRPRWARTTIGGRLWPYADGKRPGYVATMTGQLGRALNVGDSRGVEVSSLIVLEVTDHDKDELDRGSNPASLFARIGKEFKEDSFPLTHSKNGLPEVVEWLIDGPLRPLDTGSDLTPWTSNPLLAKVEVEVPVAPASGLTLSDGSPFHERVFGEFGGVTITDAQFLTMCRGPVHRRYPLLLGPAGTGKTAVIEATSHKVFETLATRDTTTLSLYGQYEPDPSNPEVYIWARSELMKSIYYAVEHPDELVTWYCDELMQMPTEVQTALHPLTDHRRSLIIEQGPEKGTHRAPDNWHAVFSSNPNEPGSEITRPLASRCAPFPYLTNWDVVEKVIGQGHELLLTLAQAMETMRQNRLVEWAPQIRHMVRVADDTNWLGLQFALGNLVNQCDLETGSCESEDVRQLEMLIAEHFSISRVRRTQFA